MGGDQKGVEEMSELVVRVSFVGFCSPCVWGLSGCWTVCAGSTVVLWSCCAIDQGCSPGRSRARSSTTRLPPPGRPTTSVNSPREKKVGEMDYLFSWRSLDGSRLCCVAGDEEEVDFSFVGAVCGCVAELEAEEDDCC